MIHKTVPLLSFFIKRMMHHLVIVRHVRIHLPAMHNVKQSETTFL